jgi:SAM-dependent methyltransferase/uncharacterized protein YbaR (Trm112 family)
MYPRLLSYLRCPACRGTMRLEPLVATPDGADGEVSEGLLHCDEAHVFPVVRGVPRLLPDSLREHLPLLRSLPLDGAGASARQLMGELTAGQPRFEYDERTRASFSSEWEHHKVGDKTWGMELDFRVDTFFVSSIGIPKDELPGKVMLDAGCGNGSQSVAYTAFGLEVIAIDLSSGLEHGQAFRHRYPNARPDQVHFIQADLQRPPLAHGSVDIIHSAGVLHHTPSTERTFRALRPLLRPGGTFYVWLYKYERFVTPLVNGIRRGTVKLPAPAFDRLARAGALPFRAFCALTTRTGLRTYPEISQREAALALTDIFGVPYAHYHSFPEVREWFKSEGFDEPWPCNESRRGFGICGRLPGGDAGDAAGKA